MRALARLEQTLKAAVAALDLSWPEKAVIEAPRDPRHGDLAANIALVLAKQSGTPPRALAEDLRSALLRLDAAAESPVLAAVDVAGPGFLNVTFAPSFWQATINAVEEAGSCYGASKAGYGRRVMVEYVSANPTGPLHIGHGRGAAVGDSLARLLRFAGYDVTTEYYINDAGRQMRLLGLSIWLRMREEAGLPVTLPEDFYRGEYIRDIAHDMLARDPQLAKLPDSEGEARCFDFGMTMILDGIKEDLREFRVSHQNWFSERSLVESGAVATSFAWLLKKDLAYEQENALWFRSTLFGDGKDRVLRKSDGSLTYFASDIAYHHDKYRRGFDLLVDVWGADHHGYVPRLRAAIAALGREPQDFDVVLIQLVNLMRQGTLVAMSTRAGTFETLADVVREVGVDAARFMFLSRKSDSPLDFDLDLVKQRSMDNPVYYVQYAHARTCSVLRRATEQGTNLPALSPLSTLARLDQPEDLALLRLVGYFGELVKRAAADLAVHSISHYLMELASALHSYYAKHPVLQADDTDLMLARMALMRAVGQTLHNGLELLGVHAPDSM